MLLKSNSWALPLCVLAGVGIAVVVATLSPPHDEAANANATPAQQSEARQPIFASVSVPGKRVSAPNLMAARLDPGPTSSPSHDSAEWLALERQKLLAGQIEQLQSSLNRVQDGADRQQRDLHVALVRLQGQVEKSNEKQIAVPPVAAAAPAPAPEEKEPVETLPPTNATRVTRDSTDNKLTIILQDSDIRDALKLLSEQSGLNILASEKVAGKLTASLVGVEPEAALAAILKSGGYVARTEDGIVYIGLPADFEAMDQGQDQVATRVYRPNYVKANDLQVLLTPLLSAGVGKITVSTPSEVDIAGDQTKTGGNSFIEPDVVIVRDYGQVLLQIDQVFAEVDVMPRQVSLEAMIVNVKLNDDNRMGVNFEALRNKGTVRITSEGPSAALPTGAQSAASAGLKIAFLDDSLGAFLTALETVGDTNVVASPRLTCLNKQRAEIQIGEQLGYVNTTVTQTFSTQSVSFLDVGTLLRMRPYIGNDGTIRMEVHPELSTGSVTVTGGLTLPNKSVTQVTTNVLCQDGRTAIIGGLIREDLQTTSTGIPLLSRTPWIGPLFRNKTEKIGRSEIIVLITPRIISNETLASEGAKYGNQFAQRQEVYFDKMNPIARRNYGLAWLRRARAAYAASDYDTAMREVNMAIHHDPLSRDAINLRNDIVAAGGFQQESIHEHLNQGLPPLTRSVKDYSKQGHPWQNDPPFSADLPGVDPHAHDPGVPGRARTLDQPPPLKPVFRTQK